MKPGPKPKPAYERMMKKVIKQPNGCWLYGGSQNVSGHGNVRVWDGHKWTCKNAHVVSAEYHHGPLPEGKTEWRHTCDVTNCVAPEHLVPGTHKENMYDIIERGNFMGRKPKREIEDECPF